MYLTSPADSQVKYPEYLETLAQQAEPDVRAKQHEIAAAVQEEWKRQSDGFSFDCKRYGDFLTIFMERKGNPTTSKYDWEVLIGQKFSTTLNIGKSTDIKLIQGNPPDDKGEVSYRFEAHQDGGGSNSGILIGSSGSQLEKGWHYVVSPNYQFFPTQKPFVYIERPPSPNDIRGGLYGGGQGYQIKYLTKDYPRVSEDDRIVFGGIRATLFVPFGKGDEVYKAILTELGRGAP